MTNQKLIRTIALILICVGLIGVLTILIYGEKYQGVSDMVPWGSLISIYIFFAASSVGLTLIASLWYIFKIPAFKVLTKRALVLAIISVVLGFIAIGLELGNPLNMIWLIFSPNITSGIWWMGTLYVLYLGFRMLTVYFLYKNHEARVVLFSRITVAAGILAVSNLGAVFGNLHARPFWQGTAMPIYFMIVALLSGAAIMAITYYLVEKFKPEGDGGESIVPILGKVLLVSIAVTGFYKFWNMVTYLYGQVPGKFEAAMALLAGPLSFSFWVLEVGLALVIPAIILAASGFAPLRVFVASSILLVGVFFMHVNFITAGQIVPLEIVPGQTEMIYHSYVMMPAEWAVFLGTIGGGLLLVLWAEKKFFSKDIYPTVISEKTQKEVRDNV